MSAAGLEVLLYCVLLGIGLGILFAALEAVRLVLGLGKILTGLLDILFCAVSACASFILALAVCQGRIRFFQFGAELLGFLLIHWTLTYAVKRILPRLLQRLSRCEEKIGRRMAGIWEKQRCRRKKDRKKLFKKRILSDSIEKTKKRLE